MIALTRRKVVFRLVLGAILLWGALRPMRRLLALVLVLTWKFRQICSIIVLPFGKLATIHYELCFPSAASDGPRFPEAGDVSTEVEVRRSRRRKQAVITRHLVPLSGQEPGQLILGATSGAESCWSRPLTMVLLK